MNHEKFEINQRKKLRKAKLKMRKAEMKQALKDEKAASKSSVGIFSKTTVAGGEAGSARTASGAGATRAASPARKTSSAGAASSVGADRKASSAGAAVIKKEPARKTGKNRGNGASFLVTFLILFLLFTASLVGGRTLIGSFAAINPFVEAEEVVALETLIDENSPFFETYKNSHKVNVLLLGINGGMTDTIMLVSFDMDQKKVDVISVPRDTYYHRPGYDSAAEMKINAAYRGEAINTAKAVSDVLLGMPINYYAVIEYDGVENIVDSMGGVPMNIPFHMVYSDPYDTPPLVIDIPEGPQTLDGEHAVQFLRFRHGYVEGDMGRVKAQQEFVKNAFKQCLGFDLPKIAKTVFQNVESDITLGTAVKIASKAVGISGESITTYMIPNNLEPDPPYYVYPYAEGISEMIEEIYAVPVETTDGAVEAE